MEVSQTGSQQILGAWSDETERMLIKSVLLEVERVLKVLQSHSEIGKTLLLEAAGHFKQYHEYVQPKVDKSLTCNN